MTDTTPRGKPPCGPCQLCCRNWSAVEIRPDFGDDPSQYKTVWAGNVLLLDFKDNGDCVYLGENGCTIHDRAPTVCRLFDCRAVFLQFTREQRRAMQKEGNMSREVFARGREFAPTLPSADRREIMHERQQGVGRVMLDGSRRLDSAMGKDPKTGKVANARFESE